MIRVVNTEKGVVRGLPAADPRITSFKGIPFAAPPTGRNRWRAPQPAPNWEGVLNAVEFAPIPMQSPTVVDTKNNIYCREWAVDPDIAMGEDCLYLNVWTPACSPDEKLPVYIWFFGGGLQSGHTAEMEFDGERIARRGIVVVTVSYRLNVFGFLCHPEITAEAGAAPSNFGHLDQQAGVLWVRRNIEAFGGDASNITIGGQSAGGGSVLAQITSPQNEGLFQKAIIESGIINAPYPNNRMPIPRINLHEAEKMGESFFEFLGVKTLEDARALDAFYVRDKMLAFGKFFGTVIDGQFCIGDSFQLLLDNKRWTVPLLLGYTTDEFICSPKAETFQELEVLAAELFGEKANEFLALCREGAGNPEEAVKKAAVNGIAYAIHVAGNANAVTNANVPMYCYRFDAEIPGWDNPGTFHSVDLWFFFETLAKCWRPFVGKHYDLARQMCNYWANFIRNGDPNGRDANGEDMLRWDAYTPDAPYLMEFADKADFVKERPGKVMDFLVKQKLNEVAEENG